MGKVLLIADDLRESQEMINHINSNPDIHLVSVTDNVFIWTTREEELSEGKKVALNMPAERQKNQAGSYSDKLDALGMKPSLNGRRYLLEALELLDKGMDKKDVCKKIGSKYGKSEESVRGAMKRAIQTTWESMPDDVLQNNYTARLRLNKKAPTVMEFLHYYA